MKTFLIPMIEATTFTTRSLTPRARRRRAASRKAAAQHAASPPSSRPRRRRSSSSRRPARALSWRSRWAAESPTARCKSFSPRRSPATTRGTRRRETMSRVRGACRGSPLWSRSSPGISQPSGRRPSCARDDDKSLTARGACRTVSAPREQFPRRAAPRSARVLTLGRPGLAPARFLTPPRALDASTRARDADKGLSKGLSKSLASGRRPSRARDDDKGLSKGRAGRTVTAAREQFPRPAAPGSAGVRGRPGAARTGRRDRS
mmetsp:Transcript_6316/g.19062  ORF Transcript_6316/g.19062 Transcript_6316/m.19062 type:complete len:262 (+) Transcript_6316:130-915(+)